MLLLLLLHPSSCTILHHDGLPIPPMLLHSHSEEKQHPILHSLSWPLALLMLLILLHRLLHARSCTVLHDSPLMPPMLPLLLHSQWREGASYTALLALAFCCCY